MTKQEAAAKLEAAIFAYGGACRLGDAPGERVIHRIALGDAIRAYVYACGGCPLGDERMYDEDTYVPREEYIHRGDT